MRHRLGVAAFASLLVLACVIAFWGQSYSQVTGVVQYTRDPTDHSIRATQLVSAYGQITLSRLRFDSAPELLGPSRTEWISYSVSPAMVRSITKQGIKR